VHKGDLAGGERGVEPGGGADDLVVLLVRVELVELVLDLLEPFDQVSK
jgi:hypothetical protein